MSHIAFLAASAATLQTRGTSSQIKNSVNDISERFELPERKPVHERSASYERSSTDRQNNAVNRRQTADEGRIDRDRETSLSDHQQEQSPSQKLHEGDKREPKHQSKPNAASERLQEHADVGSKDMRETDLTRLPAEEIFSDLKALLSQTNGLSDNIDMSTLPDIDPQTLELLDPNLFDLERLQEIIGQELNQDQLQALMLQTPMMATAQDNLSALVNQNQPLSSAAQMLESLQKVLGQTKGEQMSETDKNPDSDGLIGKQTTDPSKTALEMMAKQKQAMPDMGQSMSQHNNEAQGYTNRFDSAAIKMDGVEVLETKSFAPISQNMSANGANIVDALAKTQPVTAINAIEQIDTLQNMPQSKVLNTMKLQLKPAELGLVTAIMKMQGEVLHVDLKVENVEAFRQLNDDSSAITKALKGHGFAIEQVNVQLSLNGDKGQNQPGQQGQQNGQSFQEQADTELMQNSGQSRDERAGQRGRFGEDDDMAGPLVENSQNADLTRRDGVYL